VLTAIILTGVWGMTGSAAGQGPATQSAPATTSSPATAPVTQPAVSPEVSAVLDRLEKAGAGLRDLEANIRHELYQVLAEDRQVKTGTVRFLMPTDHQPARFFVRFDGLVQEGLKIDQKEWYCFDGEWLREIREHTKLVIDRRVVKPGERINPFELGKGPFPLPFGQKKDEMIRSFEISLVPPTKDEAAKKLTHLRLIPRPATPLAKEYKRIEFWIDPALGLPTQIQAEDRHENVITVDFTGIRTNQNLAAKDFWKDVPAGYDYQKEIIAE